MKTQLYADQLALIARLEREIGKLRRLAPLGYEKTIEGLEAAMVDIRRAIARLRGNKHR